MKKFILHLGICACFACLWACQSTTQGVSPLKKSMDEFKADNPGAVIVLGKVVKYKEVHYRRLVPDKRDEFFLITVEQVMWVGPEYGDLESIGRVYGGGVAFLCSMRTDLGKVPSVGDTVELSFSMGNLLGSESLKGEIERGQYYFFGTMPYHKGQMVLQIWSTKKSLVKLPMAVRK